MPETVIDRIVASRHPAYQQNAPKWQFFADHYQGGPDYPGKTNPLFRASARVTHDLVGADRYLAQFPLESNLNYMIRSSRACFVDLVAPAVDLYCGMVGQPSTVHAEIPGEFESIWTDATMSGDSFLSFLTGCRTHAAVYGHTFIFTDSTKATGEIRTEADVIRQGVRPYLREITPLDLLNWRLSPDGEPMEILFRVPVEAAGSILDGKESETDYEYRFWDRNSWRVFRKGSDGHFFVAEQGANSLGIVPITVLYHRKIANFRGESLIKTSARYGQLLTCWLSSLDSTLEKQSFSQAVLVSENKPSEVGVGSSTVLHLRPGRKEGDVTVNAEDFGYRSPDAGPISVMLEAFKAAFILGNKSMGLGAESATDEKATPESGISRAWRFHETQQRMVTMTLLEQEAARIIFHHCAMWKGQREFSGSISYSTKFDLGSIDDAISQAIQLQTLGIPPTARRELTRNALMKALPSLAPDVQETIDRELERLGAAEDKLAQLSG